MSKAKRILQMLQSGKSGVAIAKALKVKPNYVYYVRWMDAKKNKVAAKTSKKPSKIIEAVKETKTALDALGISKKPTIITLKELVNDVVNHPPHYMKGGIETIDFIEAKDLNYRLGNVIKYVSRAGKKLDSDPVQDLKKAAFYLNREIERREQA